jgi:hypothetical protein
MKFKRALVLSLAILPVLVVAGYAAAGGRGPMDGAAPATARFHDLDAAIAAGYSVRVADVNGITCIAQPGAGAMGVHMLNPALLDTTSDPAAPVADDPQLLVYEPKGDRMKLVALEYLVFKGPWDAHHSGPPALFGQEFPVTPSPNRYGLPAFYALHAWIWKENPSGLFSAWNPRVTCP